MIAQRRLIDPEAKKMWRTAGMTGAVGIEIGVAIGIGSCGGQWLDHKFGTAPVLFIIGFAVGVGAAIKALVRVTRNYQKRISEEETTEAQRTAPAAQNSSTSSTAPPVNDDTDRHTR